MSDITPEVLARAISDFFSTTWQELGDRDKNQIAVLDGSIFLHGC